MKEHLKAWIDFSVKAIVAAAGFYLAMALFFKADYARTDALLTGLKEQAVSLQKQNQFLTALSMNNNPDALYHLALESEARGDLQGAVRQLSMALQLSQFQAQQYKIKLTQLLRP